MDAQHSSGFLLKHRLTQAVLAGVLALFIGGRSSAEIIFQDSFTGRAGDVTNSVPAIDVQGDGWHRGASTAGLQTDGQGHLYNPLTNAKGVAGVQLIPIGRDGFMTASATLKLPVGSTEWIGFGFANTNEVLIGLGSRSGPWLQVQGNGTLTLYGGSGQSNPTTVPSAFTNTGAPVRFALTYDAYLHTASVSVITPTTTNLVVDALRITNSLSSILAKYLVFQCPTNLMPSDPRLVSDVSLDWFPRPRPLLSLATSKVVMVPAPTGASDIANIQEALHEAATNKVPTEVRFQSGATYLIATNTTDSGVPLLLVHATNVVVNGNGAKILITNPHVGFFDVYLSENIIVEGFTVDYDPLPFTQGVVTTNMPAEGAFEFLVDPAYPMPTNSYFLEIPQWGTFMDPTRPGRLADDHSNINEFPTNGVTATATPGVFKVTLKNKSKLSTVHVGDKWCQLARFNGSTLFRARFSSQITFMNLTNYTGAAAAFAGNGASLVNEVNCQIVIGPSPGGSNGVPRIKTTNADGGLFGNPRIGPWVEGCNFIGLSDDVANANTLPFFIIGPVPASTNTFHVKGYNPGGAVVDIVAGDILVGDDITVYNGTNGVVMARVTVTAVNPPHVTFSQNLTNLYPGADTTHTCLFDNSLNSSAVYLNNQFSNSRIHGIYCRANNILIAHNYVTGMGCSAIAAHPALNLSGPNSFVPTNAVIMDNVLADGGVSYEAINNSDPDDEPVWALLQLHKAIATSDYVKQGTEISGIRILHNTFLDWRRGAITLHNVSDARIVGNYFSPPLTNNGLTALTNHVAFDLWSCAYNSLYMSNNVIAQPLMVAQATRADGKFTNIPSAFGTLASPRLDIAVTPENVSVGWLSVAPAFVLQEADALSPASNWTDVAEMPYVIGASNVVNLPFESGSAHFYRARQQ